MKHNRPAVKLSVICKPQDEQKITHLIFQQQLTFGIRKQLIPRTVLARTFVSVDTQYGRIKIKVGKLNNKVVIVKPEFSDCCRCPKI